MGSRRNHYWTVLKTKQTTSMEARQHVGRQGFEIYHPMYRSRPERGVRRNLPLFPYYLLVKVNTRVEQWKSLKSTRGVSHLFLSGERPARVPDEHVQQFRDIENDMGYVVLPEHDAPRFQSQEPVSVRSGWLAGCEGIYHGLAGNTHERVKVLFSILGKPQVLEVSAFDLASSVAA